AAPRARDVRLDAQDRRADIDRAALVDQQLGPDALERARQLDERLGRLDLAEELCRQHATPRGVARPAGGQYARGRSTASSTRSGLGRYSVSSAAGGNGVSKLDTRSTGASS